MGVSRSDECAECVMAIVQLRYLVKLAVAGAVGKYLLKQGWMISFKTSKKMNIEQ